MHPHHSFIPIPLSFFSLSSLTILTPPITPSINTPSVLIIHTIKYISVNPPHSNEVQATVWLFQPSGKWNRGSNVLPKTVFLSWNCKGFIQHKAHHRKITFIIYPVHLSNNFVLSKKKKNETLTSTLVQISLAPYQHSNARRKRTSLAETRNNIQSPWRPTTRWIHPVNTTGPYHGEPDVDPIHCPDEFILRCAINLRHLSLHNSELFPPVLRLDPRAGLCHHSTNIVLGRATSFQCHGVISRRTTHSDFIISTLTRIGINNNNNNKWWY